MSTKNPIRFAIAQPWMRWTRDENMSTIGRSLRLASDQGASICVFPELTITGFHRQIGSQSDPTGLQTSIRALQTLCATLSVATAVGAPTFGSGAEVYNSHIHIDQQGQIVSIVAKNGLTPSEATFFAAGRDRQTSTLAGTTCTSVLCREVEDLPLLKGQIPPETELVFWPSLVGRPPEVMEIDYLPLAEQLARQASAWVIQSNWPNSLNYPEEGTHAGESAVISPAGKTLFRLPRAEAGLAVFNLGEPSYDWFREETSLGG